MAKYTLWPGNALEKTVAAFLERKGIDPNDVLEYRISQRASDTATIELTMHYDEGPAPVEAPRVTTDNPNVRMDPYVPDHHQV